MPSGSLDRNVNKADEFSMFKSPAIQESCHFLMHLSFFPLFKQPALFIVASQAQRSTVISGHEFTTIMRSQVSEMTTQPQVVVVGSFMSDVVTYADRLPNAGETITGTKLVLCCGGKGANQCVTAARLGVKTAMIGKLGNDSFGKEHQETMRNEGIDTTHITTADSALTGVGQLTVLPNGQNRVITVSGSNAFLTVEDIHNAKGMIGGAKVLLTENQLEKETVIAALRLANESNVITVLNAAPARNDLERDFFEVTDIFCVNETEAEVTTGEKVQSVEDATKTAKKLIEMGCKKHVLITLGAQGAVLVTRGSEESPVHIKAPAANAVDTAGAGDCFLGSLAYFLASHPDLSLEKAIERACFVASLSVQRPGTQPSFPYRNELPPEFL